jgi:hypothetical protein
MAVLDALPFRSSMNGLHLGFTFEETMSGTYHLLTDPLVERSIAFSVGARVAGMRQFLKDKMATIDGEVDIEGFADKKPLSGTLCLKLLEERRLTYDFTFRANDGAGYRFHGQKDVTMVGLAQTMTTLPASLYDATGKEIARAVLRFDLHESLRPFLRSWRPRYGS